ncbi:uncharacterized protein LOC142576758 [Dermacentor variabilis]|uniref:uncharacterized protein LOC142576758 n=1 Tax=Dermacentor variabilis TaxID=34621 RepID=UPI003F5BE2CB
MYRMRKTLLLRPLWQSRRERRKRLRRRWRVRPVFQLRKEKDFTAMQRIRHDDHEFFHKFFRKTPQLFDKLLSFVAEDLTRQYHIRETPGAWRTTCCSVEKQCFPTYPACDCLLNPAMLVTAACCGVPQKPQEPELLGKSMIQEIPKCPETPQTHATPKTESMLALVTLEL